jgi:hypothetical protein
MAFRPFTIPAAKGKSFKTIGAIDVAARYFVYKPNEWASLSGIGELRVTVERAVERVGNPRGHGQTAGAQGRVDR